MIVNIKTVSCKFDVFIGRQFNTLHHFGNPFSHVKHSAATMKVDSREEAVLFFEAWIRGEAFEEVEPERRKWILENLHTLRGKVLGCFCSPERCHGEVLEVLMKELCK